MKSWRLSLVALFPVFALSAPAVAQDDRMTITFEAGGQETTRVDLNDNGQIIFDIAFGPLQAKGRVQDLTPTGPGSHAIVVREHVSPGSVRAEFTNLTTLPQTFVVTVRGRPNAPGVAQTVFMKYEGRVRDVVSLANPASLSSHSAEGWTDDLAGSPVMTLDGPEIDIPSGEGAWSLSATAEDLPSSRPAFRWTFTVGPSDRVLLRAVRLEETCIFFTSGAASGRVPPIALLEGGGAAPAGAPSSCPLPPSLTGDCANYRWYNICSGYIWIYGAWESGQGVGVQFGGPTQPCVAPGNRVERVITYYRNVVGNYGRVDVLLERDDDGDGCPDGIIASDLGLDPALRWNCSTMNVCIPSPYVLVRTIHSGCVSPAFATDGPHSSVCDPLGTPRSFFYGNDGTCLPWDGPTDRADNFLYWLVVDSNACATATEKTTWGHIKGLYR